MIKISFSFYKNKKKLFILYILYYLFRYIKNFKLCLYNKAYYNMLLP